jgi:hypothetical protein
MGGQWFFVLFLLPLAWEKPAWCWYWFKEARAENVVGLSESRDHVITYTGFSLSAAQILTVTLQDLTDTYPVSSASHFIRSGVFSTLFFCHACTVKCDIRELSHFSMFDDRTFIQMAHLSFLMNFFCPSVQAEH